jgi:hypothetical protein
LSRDDFSKKEQTKLDDAVLEKLGSKPFIRAELFKKCMVVVTESQDFTNITSPGQLSTSNRGEVGVVVGIEAYYVLSVNNSKINRRTLRKLLMLLQSNEYEVLHKTKAAILNCSGEYIRTEI